MIRGLITAEVTGADLTGTLRSLTGENVTLLCAVPVDELTMRITVQRQDFRKLRRICEKRGDLVTILNRQGAYWLVRDFLRRPVLAAGCLLILILTLCLPSRVLFVRVEGNAQIPARRILEVADSCGIGFGAYRRAVRSEKMKNTLLEAMPELQWAGVNTEGCVAVITVRERTAHKEARDDSLCHIVALTDAVVSDCTATRGTLLCEPGQAVQEGQILISGYTDTGLTIRADRAEGEVYGQTKRFFRCVTPALWDRSVKTGEQMKKISLLLGKKRINLWKDSGISDATCDRMYEEYYITLPGDYRLPLAIAVETFTVRELTQREIPGEEAENLLSEFAESSLRQIMIAGTINSCEIFVMQEPGIWMLAGEYRCTELIGIRQRIGIGEENE